MTSHSERTQTLDFFRGERERGRIREAWEGQADEGTEGEKGLGSALLLGEGGIETSERGSPRRLWSSFRMDWTVLRGCAPPKEEEEEEQQQQWQRFTIYYQL